MMSKLKEVSVSTLICYYTGPAIASKLKFAIQLYYPATTEPSMPIAPQHARSNKNFAAAYQKSHECCRKKFDDLGRQLLTVVADANQENESDDEATSNKV